ncbi:MAG: hypothetical protein ACYC1C_17165 [Chloroflexota bacterium]
MQSETTPQNAAQVSQTVTWLDGELRKDRAEIQKLQQSLEQVAVRYREAFGRLEMLEGELRQTRTQSGRIGHAEDVVRQLREVIAFLQEWREEHESTSARAAQSQALDAERDGRILATVQSQLAVLASEGEVLKSRLILLGDEVKRGSVHLPPIQQELIALSKRVQAVSDRLDLTEESQRHRDVQIVALSQQTERLGGEQSHFTDWQRLAEVRWTRQLGEWQQQMEDWRQQSEESVRELAGFASLLPAMREETAELRRGLAEARDRLTGQNGELVELAAQRKVDREAIAKFEQRIVAVMAGIDEVSGRWHSLSERLERMLGEQQALADRLRSENERTESMQSLLLQMQERDNVIAQRLEETIVGIGNLHREREERTADMERRLLEITRRLDLRLAEIEHLEEEHKQRELVELEQQIREMQERARQTKS